MKFFPPKHTHARTHTSARKEHFYPRNGNESVTNLIRNGKVSTNERIQMFRKNIFVETNFNKFFYICEYLFISKVRPYRVTPILGFLSRHVETKQRITTAIIIMDRRLFSKSSKLEFVKTVAPPCTPYIHPSRCCVLSTLTCLTPAEKT